jgi:nucleoside-diphosphate-sugar epimerase
VACSAQANVDGARAIIKRCKDVGHCPRLVFSSSVAVYGPLPASVAVMRGAIP